MSWNLLDKNLKSRLLLGSSGYPSPGHIQDSVESSGSEIVTVALRRSGGTSGLSSGNEFWNLLKSLPVNILPNTAGCHSVKEAITTAHMAREIFDTNWIKLEITGDDYTLQPDPFGLVEASKELVKEGFEVFPYMTEDLVLADRLLNVGVRILMPWGSPIGSGQGLLNPYGLKTMRNRFPEATLIVDAGIGCPSDAALAMEMGFDGVLLNSAVAGSQDPAAMAKAFSLAIESGRLAYKAGMMEKRDFAKASTSVIGTPFWHQN
jgi:thiazole synthase